MVFVSIVDGEFEFSFFGPEDDGLPFHAADHVEGSLGLAAQSHLQQVFLDAGLDGFAQFAGDLKEAVRRTKSFDALVGPLVVVIFDPEPDPLPGGFETLELGAGQELLPDGLPKTLDLAQRHRVMGPGFEMSDAALLEFRLEAGRAPPGGVLPAVVRQHLLGRVVFAHGDAEDLEHVLGGLAAKDIRPDQVAGVIIHEADQIGITAAQPEGEDVGLPHLVGRGPLEEAGPDQIAPRLGRAFNQLFPMESLADGLRTGFEEENPFEQLGDALDPPARVCLFQFDDFVTDRFRKPGGPGPGRPILESLLALLPIQAEPLVHGVGADVHLLGHQADGEALLEVQFDGAQAFLKLAAQNFFSRSPLGGDEFLFFSIGSLSFMLTLLYH